MKKRMNLVWLLVAFLFAGNLCVASAAPKNKVKTPKQVRLMVFNIADGMWYDQYNHYDRFADWTNKVNPDVFAICEAATHWDENKKSTPRDVVPRYLPDSLEQLAMCWGHPYVVVGPYQDNYPVAITSRYPIETIQRIGGENMSHGALHVKIAGVNYVVLHLWPQRYGKADKTKKDNNGTAFRLQEMQQILDSTILNPKYAAEKHWMMMGDFNTLSPIDSATYVGRKNVNYEVQKKVRKAYPHDVIADFYPTQFVSSTGGKTRIDYIYCTDELMKNTSHAEIRHDDFTKVSSDHRPVIMDFKNPKK